jgi:hydroxyacylglutathione hydrolase
MFQRYFDEGLAQSSFLIGCDRTKQAVVIDPRRDAAIYVAAARHEGFNLVGAIETHIHADFVSGAHELHAAGVRVIGGPGSHLDYPHTEATDGQHDTFGDLSLTFLATPGHTPEHIAVRADLPGSPTRLFTGDLLFVGAVGRPDLLGSSQTSRLAHDLFHSLRRVMTLGDDVEVHPGHGAGSLCGAGIGKEPYSTIGRERNHNPMLRYEDADTFANAVLSDLPETPPYFVRMKRINREGPALRGLVADPPPPPALRPAAAAMLVADGAVLLDLRPGEAFAAEHPAGALNFAYGPKIGYWAGWILPPDSPIILLADQPAHAREAMLQLLRVGIDRVEGFVEGGIAGWRGATLPTASTSRLSAADLRTALAHRDEVRILDVRTVKEWKEGHIDGAMNIPLGELSERIADLPADKTIVTICEAGYRSSLAASILEREGIPQVANVTGGMNAYRALEAT